MLDPSLIAFAVAAALLTITPGADTMLVLRNVLRGGRLHGITTTFGVCSGLFVHACLSALGLSVILTHSAAAYAVVKYAGAAYLVWLGLKSIRRALKSEQKPTDDPSPLTPTRWLTHPFVEGFLTNILNPKVIVFYLAFLPQFIDATDPVLPKSVLLASIHVMMGIAWLSGVSALIDRAHAVVRRPAVRRALDGISGTVLAGLGAKLLAETR